MPLKATLTPKEIDRASKPKRKAPRQRLAPHCNIKRRRSNKKNVNFKELTKESVNTYDAILEGPKDVGIQTYVSKHELSSKLNTMMFRNFVASSKVIIETEIVCNIAFEII